MIDDVFQYILFIFIKDYKYYKHQQYSSASLKL